MSNGRQAQIVLRSPEKVALMQLRGSGFSGWNFRRRTRRRETGGRGRDDAPAHLLLGTSSKIWGGFWLYLFLSIGFAVGGICFEILAVSGMSVLVFHFLGEFSSFLILQKYFGRSEKKLPQELWATCYVGSNFSPESLNSVVQINELSQTISRTKLRTIHCPPHLTVWIRSAREQTWLRCFSLVSDPADMLTFHIR